MRMNSRRGSGPVQSVSFIGDSPFVENVKSGTFLEDCGGLEYARRVSPEVQEENRMNRGLAEEFLTAVRVCLFRKLQSTVKVSG